MFDNVPVRYGRSHENLQTHNGCTTLDSDVGSSRNKRNRTTQNISETEENSKIGRNGIPHTGNVETSVSQDQESSSFTGISETSSSLNRDFDVYSLSSCDEDETNVSSSTCDNDESHGLVSFLRSDSQQPGSGCCLRWQKPFEKCGLPMGISMGIVAMSSHPQFNQKNVSNDSTEMESDKRNSKRKNKGIEAVGVYPNGAHDICGQPGAVGSLVKAWTKKIDSQGSIDNDAKLKTGYGSNFRHNRLNIVENGAKSRVATTRTKQEFVHNNAESTPTTRNNERDHVESAETCHSQPTTDLAKDCQNEAIDQTEGDTKLTGLSATTNARDDKRRILKKKFVKTAVMKSDPQKSKATIDASRDNKNKNNARKAAFNFAEMSYKFIQASSSAQEREYRSCTLKFLRTNANTVWNNLTDREKGEKVYVLAALFSAQLPRSMKSPYDWIKSTSLLEDRDVVLAILKCDTAFTVLDGRLSIPCSLRDDKEVMIEYIRRRSGRLSMVDESLLDDRDVVMAAVSQYGQDLQHASEGLRMDKKVIEAACKVYGGSFQYSLGEARQQLGSNRLFMNKVLESFKGGAMLEFASDEIQREPSFACKALINDFEFSKLPEGLKTDPKFLLKLIQHDSYVYTKFPIGLKRNRVYAMMAILSCKDTYGSADACKQKAVVVDVCQYANYLFREENASRQLVTNTPLEVAQDILREGSSFIEKNLVVFAVRHNAFLYGEHLLEPFRSDLDVIKAAIKSESAGHVLRNVPRWTLLNHPQLVILAIEVCHASKIESHKESLGAVGLLPWEIFRNRPVVAAWAKAGFPLTPSFPTDFANDEEICLFFLANVQNIWRYRLRKWISGDLKGNKAFMTKACAYDASFFAEGTNDLSHDYDVLLVAASVDFDQVIRTMTDLSEPFALRQFCEKVQDRMRACEGYHLVAWAVNNQNGSKDLAASPLLMLDQGRETRTALLKFIGQHLDLPPSEEFQRLDSIRFTVRQLLCTLPKQ